MPDPVVTPRPARLLLILSLLAGGCAMPSEERAVRNVHTVTPGVLVRGGQPDEAGFRALQQAYGIRTVVNFNDKTADSEAAIAKSLGLNYLAVPSVASRLDPEKILAFLKVMENADTLGPIYVHCKAGQDRTGAAVAAYRIVVLGWDTGRALDELLVHQEMAHTLVFGNIPRFVRSIEGQRADWLARLDRIEQTPVDALTPVGEATASSQ